MKRKPVTQAQIGLLRRLGKFITIHGDKAWFGIYLMRDFMIASALRKKGLIETEFHCSHDEEGEPYAERYGLHITKKGIRYLSFIAHLEKGIGE